MGTHNEADAPGGAGPIDPAVCNSITSGPAGLFVPKRVSTSRSDRPEPVTYSVNTYQVETTDACGQVTTEHRAALDIIRTGVTGGGGTVAAPLASGLLAAAPGVWVPTTPANQTTKFEDGRWTIGARATIYHRGAPGTGYDRTIYMGISMNGAAPFVASTIHVLSSLGWAGAAGTRQFHTVSAYFETEVFGPVGTTYGLMLKKEGLAGTTSECALLSYNLDLQKFSDA